MTQNLQPLEHNKKLNGKNFPNFVETFNKMMERIFNIKGDYDLSKDNGYISVDNTEDGYPVIRLMKGLGGSGGGVIGEVNDPWALKFVNNQWKIDNPTFQVGTYRGVADTSQISVKNIVESRTSVYCEIDMYNRTAKAVTSPRNNARYFSVEIFKVDSDEEKNPIANYKCRYPLAPVWESYSVQ